MVKIKINDRELYYDGWVAQEYGHIRDKVIVKDWDWITFVDGMEGSGKSTLAQQLALLCDPTFNIDRIAFTEKEFIDAVINANQYNAVVFDEAYGAISSKGAISKVCRTIEDLLSQIRQKNLFVFIVAPTFFDITRNIAMWRSKTLFHVRVGQNYERGYYWVFKYSRKNQLYTSGMERKNRYNYLCVPHSAKGRFTKALAVDEAKYREKKLAALGEFRLRSKEDKVLPAIEQRNALICYIGQNNILKPKEIAQLVTDNCEMSLSYTRVTEILRASAVESIIELKIPAVVRQCGKE